MAEVASWALQRGVYQALASSLDLTTLLGGVRVYDDAPQSAPYPFITLGQSVVRDWSTGTEDGAEHDLTLHVWSRSGGKKQVHEIIEAIKDRCCTTGRSRCRTITSSISVTSCQRRGSIPTATRFTALCAIAP